MTQHQNCDLLIRNAYVITVDARRRVLSPGAVAVCGHTLVAVGPEREVVQQMRAARSIDAEGAVLHPGFIDAHNHVVGAGCRGVFANDADDPVSGVNYAAWKADVTSEDEAAATTLTALQLLHAGYTGVVEAGTVFDPGAVAAAVEADGHPHLSGRPLPVGRRRRDATSRLAREQGAVRAGTGRIRALRCRAGLGAASQRRSGRAGSRVRLPVRPRHRQ